MATSGGPDIERDGLVFGMDTSYGIDTNNISSRFYPGMPTTNIVPISLSDSLWFNEYSSGRTLQSYTLFGQPAYEFKSNDGQIWVSPFAFNSYDRSTNDLTLSVYAKNIGSSAASMNTYFGGDYSTDSLGNSNTKSLPADNTWRRYSWTRFSSAMVANYLEFRTANTGVVISCPQLEIGRVVTPIVDGTRSSTQSLIDLTKSTNIDVSNVSFDSTGQPTFDGTDDHISLDPNLRPTNGVGSIEAIIKPTVNDAMGIVGWGDGGTSNWGGFDLGNRTSGFSDEVLAFINLSSGAEDLVFYGRDSGGTNQLNDGNYHHVVVVVDGIENTMYLDGEKMSTISFTYGSATSAFFMDMTTLNKLRVGNSTYNNGHIPFTGEIPVTKIYNRGLSAQEVQQNYNAYKNRFNL